MSRLVKVLLWVAVVAALLTHTAGAWYFSDQLRTDVLAIAAYQPSFDVVVVRSDEDTITLRAVGDVGDLTAPGIVGADWQSGYGQLGEPITSDANGVTRPLRLLVGEAPVAGTLVALEGFAYPGDPRRAFGLDFEDVAYRSPVGEMTAWRLRGPSTTWVVHVHGKGSSPAEALRLVGPLAAAGYPQLVINYRNDPGQPLDASGFYQYGRTEWEDLAGAIEFASENGAEKVVLVGYSDGAALGLSYLYSSVGPVVGAVFDAPNIDLGATVSYRASQRKLPLLPMQVPATLAWAGKQVAAFRFDISWETVDYVSRAADLEVPVLVIHGSDDLTVPLSSSERFARARPDLVTLVPVTNAGHVRSWNLGPDAYQRRVLDFVERLSG
jgi:uncharacterized protein